MDVRLSGLLLGQTLHTEAHEIYRALIEATAFGALTIIKRIEEYGVPVKEIVNCGGMAEKNPLLMQIYADVTGRPMKVSRSDQTCALGAAIFGAVAAGKEASGFASVPEAQRAVCGVKNPEEKATRPSPPYALSGLTSPYVRCLFARGEECRAAHRRDHHDEADRVEAMELPERERADPNGRVLEPFQDRDRRHAADAENADGQHVGDGEIDRPAGNSGTES